VRAEAISIVVIAAIAIVVVRRLAARAFGSL
jgi:hypothetical protein